MVDDIERATIRRVAWRLLPLVFLLYLLSLVDRVNLGFAALTMNKDLGLTPYTYSLGVAAFFFGYIPCEVPSNLILERIGARRWIGRIAITWGIAASAMALVSGERSFLLVRFLLGVAEAGLFPGMLLYLTYWFPRAYRARVNAALVLAIPASGAIGAPVATSLLELNGLFGVAGWKWMFLLEGIPTILVGLVAPADRPARERHLARAREQGMARGEDATRTRLGRSHPQPTERVARAGGSARAAALFHLLRVWHDILFDGLFPAADRQRLGREQFRGRLDRRRSLAGRNFCHDQRQLFR